MKIFFLKKILPALILWAILAWVIFFIPYPNSLTEASNFQLLVFFIPLFLSMLFTLNILLSNIPSSIIASFGLILLLILKALNSLTPLFIIITLIAVLLLISYFKMGKSEKGLTSASFIPKLKSLRRKNE